MLKTSESNKAVQEFHRQAQIRKRQLMHSTKDFYQNISRNKWLVSLDKIQILQKVREYTKVVFNDNTAMT